MSYISFIRLKYLLVSHKIVQKDESGVLNNFSGRPERGWGDYKGLESVQ